MKKTAYALVAGFLICINTHAQDFYNGFRGPKATQIDLYANHLEGKVSGTIIPKVFTKNIDSSLVDLVIAVPNGISNNGKIENKGVNIGYICEMNNASIIGALGLFRNESGKYRIVNPQLYATLAGGPWTFDIESNYPIKTDAPNGSASATIGYGINNTIRIGGSIIFNEGKEPDYKGNIRIELAEDHSYWLQGYVSKNAWEARLAINL